MQVADRSFEAIGEEAFVPRTSTKSRGFFVTEQAKWNAFQVDLGARVDHVAMDPDGFATTDFSPVSLSAGALWHFNDTWRLSANLDRAERAPAEEELFANGPHVATAAFEIGDPALRKERANQAELGRITTATLGCEGFVVRDAFDGFIYLLDNRFWSKTICRCGNDPGDARFRGGRRRIDRTPVRHERDKLDLRVFGDHVRAELDDGGNLPRIAPTRIGVDLRWDSEAWRASIGAVRYAKQDEFAVNETPTDGYTLVDAHFAYHGTARRSVGTSSTAAIHRPGPHVHTSFLKDTVVRPAAASARPRLFSEPVYRPAITR